VILKPFQLEGAAFLAARTRALLADEPGTGKTGQLVTACEMVGARDVGVVCPSIGVEHWRREFQKWGGTCRADIIPWDDAHEWVDKTWNAPRWDVLIPDEAHFGKNPNTRRTAAVFAKGGLAWYARRVWAASGTPSPNNAAELWPMLRAFGKTPMDLEQFTRYFCYVDERGKPRGNRPDRIEELRAILRSVALRRLKKDVLPELGAIDIQDWYVKPSSAFITDDRQFDATCAMADAQETNLRREINGKSPEDLLAFLAGGQDFSTLRRYNALLKAPAVFETVKFELENDLLDKVVVYGIHTEALTTLHRAFRRANIPSALIIGDTPKDARDGLIEDWKRKGKVLIASSIIAGTVLDFTCAHQGIMLELDWVPSSNAQAMQRMHRHGQTNPVTIRVATGSAIDETINTVLIRKIRDFDALFGGGAA
jgi:SWI/SNF-related matrix-associated actin-dependent regulator 1 of chromatin subfamily A